MKKIIFILTISVLLFSCEKYPEPGNETIEYFNFNIVGNYQNAEDGNYLSEKVGAQIDLNSIQPKTNKKYRMEIQVSAGDGSVDHEVIQADAEGKMITQWKLGNKSNQQELTCQILDSDNLLISEFTIESTAFFYDKLNTITSGYFIGIQDMVYDTINHRSMMTSGRDLYINTGKLYEWKPINGFGTSIKALEINSKGEIFAAVWNGELYKTSDWGETWSHLRKPIPDNRYHYELTITKDDYIWANKWEHGVYCSKDNGLTWTKDTVGLTKQEELGRIFSFADTSHMAISYANLTIHKTTDDGKTWHAINTPEYSQSMFVTDDNAIIAQNQNGFNLHKSTDGGKTYKSVFRANVAFGTSSKHCYEKYKNNYYVLAPGGGVWKTKDFEEYEELISFALQRNLFIDHNGTIYASGFNYSNIEPDPTYVLPYSE